MRCLLTVIFARSEKMNSVRATIKKEREEKKRTCEKVSWHLEMCSNKLEWNMADPPYYLSFIHAAAPWVNRERIRLLLSLSSVLPLSKTNSLMKLICNFVIEIEFIGRCPRAKVIKNKAGFIVALLI